MRIIYEIKVDYYGSPIGSCTTGIAFTDEKAAKEFINRYVSKKNRDCFYIEKRYLSVSECKNLKNKNSLSIYSTIENMLSKQPEREIARLEAVQDELVDKIYLPFNLTFENVDSNFSQQRDEISRSELKNIIKNISQDENFVPNDEVEFEKLDDRKLDFVISETNNEILMGQITYGQYQELKKIAKELDNEISLVENNLKTLKDNKDNDKIFEE